MQNKVLNYNFIWDESDWYKFQVKLKQYPLFRNGNIKKLPFVKSRKSDLRLRCNEVAYSIISRRIPLIDINSLAIINPNP